MKYHRMLNERKMVFFVVQPSRYFGPCRILPYPAVSCRILPYLPYPVVSCRILPYPTYPAVSCRILPYPAVSCRILPYPAVSCRILPYRIRVTGNFYSWKHSSSLAVHLQGVVFLIRSVRGAEE